MKKLDKDPNVIMMKGALKPSLVVGLLGLIISTWLQGSAGLYGAMLAQLVVLVFFLVNIGVASMTKNVDPIATMAFALLLVMASLNLKTVENASKSDSSDTQAAEVSKASNNTLLIQITSLVYKANLHHVLSLLCLVCRTTARYRLIKARLSASRTAVTPMAPLSTFKLFPNGSPSNSRKFLS